ncbi:MAG TPA: polyribonucleotide nucleotidyltransferase [Nitrospinota bacterium]|nr:polyribonucleotide nucleotidyltransferase [Nitrospinota bacterium]
MQAERVELQIGSKILFIETGILAKQAAGSVVVGIEETIILCAATAEENPREGIDFLPLTVDYRDKTAAAGRIPGGFFKREARPGDHETLTSRLVDRTIRPMFTDGYGNETQVIINPLSFDYENETDVLAITGASAALAISHLPFNTPVSGVRVGRVDGEFICNPTLDEQSKSDMNLIVCGTDRSLVMVEGGANEVSEAELVSALEFAHGWIKKICQIQMELMKKVGKVKMEIETIQEIPEIAELAPKLENKLKETVMTSGKQERSKALKELRDVAIKDLTSEETEPVKKEAYKEAFSKIQKNFVRNMILNEEVRVDGRALNEIRDISISVDALPRTHGSALFTRGETQALVTTTLGTGQDELTLDRLGGRSTRHFMLHYNFPPFCVGEVKRITGPGRREIGHGTLAERSMDPILPSHEDFPYTIRVVSEILESNGSSSMATVCGASLCLMDAGVPIKSPVAGIAMGLVKDDKKVAILSDILGLEDALGDMDFKVAGTRNGITAVQMDIKIDGLDVELMTKALSQAKEGRIHILDKMDEAISSPRKELNPNAPRIHTVQINPDKVRDLIGPGGKVIRGIVADTGAQIDVDDEGNVKIFASDGDKLEAAVSMVEYITQEAVVGKVYDGIVKRITDFGAFVEIFTGTEGLVHISQVANFRINSLEDIWSEGDQIPVKVIEVDPTGKIRLSFKEAVAGTDKEIIDTGDQSSGYERDRDRGRRAPNRGGGRGDRNNRR